MTYNTILFDLDGTLTDPKVGILNSVKYALQKMNKAIPIESELLKFIGPPIQQSFSEIFQFNEKELVNAVRFYREYFSQSGMIENNVYDGIRELLSELQKEKKRLYVATSKPTIFAREILIHFQLDEFFIQIVGSELDGTRIDKGEIIEYIFEKNNELSKEDSVMVGDRFHDIKGAKIANIDSIGITYGYGTELELTNAGANAIINSVDQLKKMLLNERKIMVY
ncbi:MULTISPECIES: HAD family hydrolase [Bacillaceae]|uniref:HAD family hydrolase n=1 Tax=Bacillaceae TaxID=186817 RepID=UPI000BEC9915|nr:MULTISPECIES: HAD family hydrolase [unclassified Bacillus (in: firmicutes)]PEC51515.1 phosphoglycolate phosphatase [Bacillus sp. AFS096315]PFM78689.1 phosphoglycolate phosphatase [Bacillus sp. AFS077874]